MTKYTRDGNLYTIKGFLPGQTSYDNKIILFDGRFDTGFVIESLLITNQYQWQTEEGSLIVFTEPQGSLVSGWNFGHNEQVAWASFHTPGGTGVINSYVDPDNLIVEDLYLHFYSPDEGAEGVNYLLTMRKYDISEWKGALSMVRNRSQS